MSEGPKQKTRDKVAPWSKQKALLQSLGVPAEALRGKQGRETAKLALLHDSLDFLKASQSLADADFEQQYYAKYYRAVLMLHLWRILDGSDKALELFYSRFDSYQEALAAGPSGASATRDVTPALSLFSEQPRAPREEPSPLASSDPSPTSDD